MSRITSSRKPLTRIQRRWASREAYLVVQDLADDANPKQLIDNIVKTCRGRFVEVEALLYELTTPRKLIGISKLGYIHETRINGLTCLEYLIRECHKIGVRVNAWMPMYFWTIWGGTTSVLLTPMPDDVDHHYQEGSTVCVNFGNADVRSKITAFIADFIKCNPGLDGWQMDYIRTDGVCTMPLSSVTAMVEAVRDAIKGFPLGYHARPGLFAEANDKQSMADWTANRVVSFTKAMSYISSFVTEFEQFNTVAEPEKFKIFFGITTDSAAVTPSTIRSRLYNISRWGFRNMAVFQYSLLNTNFLKEIDDWIAGRIVINQTNITKMKVVPGTSFTFALNGVDKTTLYTEINDGNHLTSGAVKTHVESVYGEQPLLITDRPTSTTIRLSGNDWTSN